MQELRVIYRSAPAATELIVNLQVRESHRFLVACNGDPDFPDVLWLTDLAAEPRCVRACGIGDAPGRSHLTAKCPVCSIWYLKLQPLLSDLRELQHRGWPSCSWSEKPVQAWVDLGPLLEGGRLVTIRDEDVELVQGFIDVASRQIGTGGLTVRLGQCQLESFA